MGIRTSHSQNSTYIACPKYWDLYYNHKWRSKVEGASLAFGGAVDKAVMGMLEGKTDYLQIFEKNWEGQARDGQYTPIFDNMDIVYSYSDFDPGVLEELDNLAMMAWAGELQIEQLGKTGVEIYHQVARNKKNPFKRTTEAELQYFSRCSWLSLKRKGILLINAFYEQFYPKIKKVLSTQQFCRIDDPNTGDAIQGVIDFVVEIEGYDKPIIFDLKTAGQPYDQDNIDMSEQLTMYSAMKSQTYNTANVGFVVLCKNIPKESLHACTKCGIIKTSRARTCDHILDGKRCSGEWKETKICKPVVQVLVQERTPEQIEELLNDVSNIVLGMKNAIVYKNSSKCSNWYGQDCVFKKVCWKKDFTGLVKKEYGKKE